MDSDSLPRGIWALTEHQHGVVSRAQLLERGLTLAAIRHRVKRGRLHKRGNGIYVVGRPELSRLGEMSAALLACGEGAVLSHGTAAELWGIRRMEPGPLHVSVPRGRRVRRDGVVAHERSLDPNRLSGESQRLAVTPVDVTLVDLASLLRTRHLERAINVADSLDLIAAHNLPSLIEDLPPLPGVAILRALLERDAFVLTESELEAMFARLVAEAGLSRPSSQQRLSRHRCDFSWPQVGLVVETDGLRYHRTAAQQRRDAERDHAHLLAGRVAIRFTHWQVANERSHVLRTLRAGAARAKALRVS